MEPSWSIFRPFCLAPFILHRQFDPVALIETVEREQVTHMMMVPSQIIAVLNAPTSRWKIQSLQMIGSMGAAHLGTKNG
jgi:acyl-coenzyme A synthetase/AMP-(fatty) acid ligase